MRRVPVRPRAFSLIELVFVLMITGLILAAVAALTSRTLDALKFMQEKSESMQSATLGVERLASELSEAITVPATPAGGVRFRKANPNLPPALYRPGVENDYTDPNSFPPHLWTRSYTGANRMQVEYATGGTAELQRRVDGGPWGLIASDVNAFTVAQEGGLAGNYRVTLSVQEKRRVLVFETIVHCPGVPR